MIKKSGVSMLVISRMLGVVALSLAACTQTATYESFGPVPTPTVDYIETLDVYSAPHKDSFLNQLAMNYRSYAIYNARTSGYSEMGELFANKAVAAFSGEVPFPESLDNWPIENEEMAFEIYTAYNDLMEQLKNDASTNHPQLAAEAQAKFDCWISATASGQGATAEQCRDRFQKAMNTLKNCDNGTIISNTTEQIVSQDVTQGATQRVEIVETKTVQNSANKAPAYYPDTRNMAAMNGAARARDGVIIVNNVNVPENLITPVSVPESRPLIFNQNIYGGDKTVSKSVNDSNNVDVQYEKCQQCRENAGCPAPTASNPTIVSCPACAECSSEPAPILGEEYVSRDEFINMMMAMREELAAINARLDDLATKAGEKAVIKVQQIPLEPTQHVMEEIFEVRFDFDKSTIKPEYEELIRKLVTATQENKNIKVSVIGHTDTMGSANYNYALGGRRAEAVQKLLIKYGIPASQIVAVSAGEEGLAVPTADGVANAANRRVQVIKEIHYTEPAPQPLTVIEEYTETQECGMYGCDE